MKSTENFYNLPLKIHFLFLFWKLEISVLVVMRFCCVWKAHEISRPLRVADFH